MVTPASDLWAKRMALGYRGQQADRPSTWVYDNLWRAACWEAAARQLVAADQPKLAEDAMARATQILTEAVDETPEGGTRPRTVRR